MPETDLSLLQNAVRAAGKIATDLFGKAAHWDKPEGAGPVTEADLAVDKMLRAELTAARPSYGWLSEESHDDGARLEHDCVFIVDPIDGTRNFVEGGRTWAISAAAAQSGVITAGVVFLPMRDMLFSAARGEGAMFNGGKIAVTSQTALSAAHVLATRSAMRSAPWKGQAPGATLAYRPSLAYRLGLVAQGRFDAMLTFRATWEWDIAAGALIVEEAGGIVSDAAGGPLRFNNAHPAVNGLIAACPGVHRDTMTELRVRTR